MRTQGTLGGLALLLLLVPTPSRAWSKQSHVDIAWEAARLSPPDLYRQIQKHKNVFRDGVVAPFEDEMPQRHEKNADGSGSLDRVIVEEVERTIAAIEGRAAFQDIVYQFGVLAHSIIEASNPLQASSADGNESKYASDFGLYMDSTTTRLPVVFYGVDTALEGPDDLAAFVARSLQRSRRLYPHIASEYKRVGYVSGLDAFDDKSTAFGVASVSYNRALTDVVVLLRYVWLQVGGADFLPRRSQDSGVLLKLSGAPESP